MMNSLQKIYERNKRGDWPDKGSVHSYIEVYESILRPYRYTAKNILEIGLMSGESLRMWSEYFAGDVYGMDCDIKPINGLADLTGAINEGFKIVIGDASKPSEIAKFFTGMKFDVVIEDANHDIDQQYMIYAALKPYLAPGSIYIIEDIQNVDYDGTELKTMADNVEIVDLRLKKLRYDDVLVIIRQ